MQLTECVYLVGSGDSGVSLTDPYDCHVYLLDGGTELALVDAGAGLDTQAVLANISGHGFSADAVRHLLLTHVHADHAGGAAGLKQACPGAAVCVARDAADILRSGDEQRISMDAAKRGGLYPASYRFEPCPVDRELEDGMTLRVGGLDVRVLNAPGHSCGHLSFVMTQAGSTHWFCGDALFAGGQIALQSIWDCDLKAHLETIEQAANLNVDVFLPGHGCFSLANGQRHIDAAVDCIHRGRVPPNAI